jgi:Short C-terminal domain
MTHPASHPVRGFKRVALCTALLAAVAPAQAGIFDSLFGNKAGEATQFQVDGARRTWRIGEFTTVALAPIEGGSAPNQHPARVTADALRWQLGGVRATVGGQNMALFATDEINDLAEPLAQAFAAAGPGDDVVLVSSSRRGASLFTNVTAVTARLFVQDGGLQLIVSEARQEFVRDYIASRSEPQFVYGSRLKAGKANLTHGAAASTRADWLVLGTGLPGAAPGMVSAPAAPAAASVVAPVAAAARSASAVMPTVAPSAAAPAAEPLQTEAEHRLATLKRLRDRGLISEEEFQEKRKEVLKQL